MSPPPPTSLKLLKLFYNYILSVPLGPKFEETTLESEIAALIFIASACLALAC